MQHVPVAQLQDYIGKDLGCSDWLTIDKVALTNSPDCTGDEQFIHVDPEKAKLTPFGSTIAHGYLSLSLIPKLSEGISVLLKA